VTKMSFEFDGSSLGEILALNLP
jgi:hypothetical protein